MKTSMPSWPQIAARLPRLVPTNYWYVQSIRRQLVLWLTVGIVLRCVLMPFTAHNEYLDSHWRSQQIADGTVRYPARTQFLSYALDAAWLRVIGPLLPERDTLLAAPPPTDGRLDAGPADFARFVADPAAQRALFLTKLIYLFVDIATGLLLLRLFLNRANGMRAFKVWMLNPAILYSVFIVGHFDSYAIFCLILSLVLAARQRTFTAALVFGIAIAFHSATLVLLPIYALGLTKQRTYQVLVVTLALLPQLLILGVMEAGLRLQPAYTASVGTGAFTGLVDTTVGASTFFPFIVGYMLLLLWLDHQPTSVETVANVSLTLYLLMYVFTFRNAYDISWLAPFAVVLLGRHRALVRAYVLFVVAWAVYWLVASDSITFTAYLFSPGYRSIQNVMPYGEWLAQHTATWQITLQQLVIIARSALSAVALWFIFRLWRGMLARQEAAA